jgi:hypothetical protein
MTEFREIVMVQKIESFARKTAKFVKINAWTARMIINLCVWKDICSRKVLKSVKIAFF